MITGGDEKQAESYKLQLKAKLDNKEIPAFTKYSEMMGYINVCWLCMVVV